MTPFLYALRQWCAECASHSRWLLAPSLSTGQQWLAQVSRFGVATDQVRVITLAELAFEFVKQKEPQLEARLVTELGARVLIDRLWPMVKAHQQEGYFSRLETTAGLSAALTDSVLALRKAGVATSQFIPEAFENPAKGIELAQLFTAYELRKELSRLIDEADIWKTAITLLIEKSVVIPSTLRLAVPEELMTNVHGLAATVLQLLPMELTTILESGAAINFWEEETFQADRQLLRWLTEPMSAPPARGDGTLRMFRAVSEADEVREIFRRCAADNIPLGDVEVLYSDAETYQAILVDTISALFSKETVEGVQLLTFGDGLPLNFTKPGRALTAWLAWVESDYRQSILLSFLQDGLLQEPPIPDAELLRQLRSLNVGWGRNRYRECFETRLRQDEPVTVLDDDGEEIGIEASAATQVLECFWEQLQPLLQLLPANPQAADWLEAGVRFVERFPDCTEREDAQARDLLLQTITDLRRWVRLEETPLPWNIPTWLRNLPNQLRLPGEVPLPGRLHAAHWSQGGHSGRPFTFVIGLDDASFPGGRLPQVLLTSPERQHLSPELPTDGRLREEQRQQFLRLLRGLAGRITVSFSCFDIIDNRERFPSWVVRGVFRLLSGQEETSQRRLEEFLGPPVGFTPNSEKHCLTEGEWWHYQLLNPPRIDGVDRLLARRYPHLTHGIYAQQQRQSNRFTEFDGWVPDAGRDHDPGTDHGMILSVSRLEKLAKCPLAFFFQHILEVVPHSDAELDPTSWLPAFVRAELLQGVFFDYHRQSQTEGKRPDYDTDLPWLLDLLHARIGRYMKRYPCPSQHAFQGETALLEQTVRMFLREQVRQGQQPPTHTAVSLGYSRGPQQPTPLDTADPVRVALSNGLSVRLRGRIDRIDKEVAEDGTESLSIVNYKFSSPGRYQDATDQREGRVMQHVFHFELAQAHLQAVQGPRATVKQVSLFFSGERGQGDRLQWTAEQMRQERDKLEKLVELLAHGAFVATNKSTDCVHCEYRRVCSVPADTQASHQKLSQAENDALNPFRELRHAKKR